ncbi:MAG: Gfo/Idh/MocA family oxidoreductase [Burkholderiales bacterium]|nr:Gfo/Idh/MocA family oxidoreductase [Burkholderiales bacterium]
MTAGKIGVGVIGLGNAAKPHARALQDLRASHVHVTGVYSRDPQRRAAFATAHGFPAAASAQALIADARTDMLLLLTPPNERFDLLDMALAHRKPVLMEKPIGRTTVEAARMVAMAEAAGVPLGVVLQHRQRRGACALARLLQRDELGRVGLVRLTVPWWRDQPYYDTPGRGTSARDGGGVLISQAIHALDLMLHLVGPVARVMAMTSTTPLHRMETEDAAVAGLQFDSGAFGAVVATTAAFPGGSEVLSIDAERGSVELGHGELVVRWRDGRVERTEDSVASGTGADPMAFDHGLHRGVIREFVQAISAGRDAPVTARSVVAVHGLIDAILESSRQGRRVDLARSPPKDADLA